MSVSASYDNDVIVLDTILPCSVLGGPGHDRIAGGWSHDGISGGDGTDVIYGRGGSDWVSGNHGNDILSGGYPPAGAFNYPGQFDIDVFKKDVDGIVLDDAADRLFESPDGLVDIFIVESAMQGMASWLVDVVETDDPYDIYW